MTMTHPLVLGADVGGTHTKVALARFTGPRPAMIKREVYPSREYTALELVIEEFLRAPDAAAQAASIAGACFAVAGPVESGRARLTNLPWHIDERRLMRHFGFSAAHVINDFAAAGLGIAHLADDDLLTLQEGTAIDREPRVVVGAGTGLGVGLLTWSEGRYRVSSVGSRARRFRTRSTNCRASCCNTCAASSGACLMSASCRGPACWGFSAS